MAPEQKTEVKHRRRSRDSGTDGPLDWLHTLSHTQRAYRKEAERCCRRAARCSTESTCGTSSAGTRRIGGLVDLPQPKAA